MDEVKFRNRMAGKIRFSEDMTSRKMVYILLIRSDCPHGLLEGIDRPEMPKEVLFLQARDIPGRNRLSLPDAEIPLLADREVLYRGQPVALLAGPDQETLKKISRDIRCRYRKIPAFPPSMIRDSRSAASEKTIRKGDIARGMNKAEHILEGEYFLDIPEVPSYPRPGVYCVKEGGRYILHLHTQWPSLIRKLCAQAAGISRKQVELRFNTAGRSWDHHIWQTLPAAALAVITASLLRRPVRLMEDTDEQPYIRRRIRFSYRAGIDLQGKLTALDTDLFLDAGAYGCFAGEVLSRLCVSAGGLYQCRNIRVSGKAFKTNTPPWLPTAGWGLPQGFFGLECLANRLAVESGADPAAWRRQNLITRGNLYPTMGQVRHNPPLPGMIDQITGDSDFIRKDAAYRQVRTNERKLDITPSRYNGIGLGISFQGNDFLTRNRLLTAATVSATLGKEGNLEIILNAVPSTPSLMVVWRKRISEKLSIDEKNISFTMDRPDEQLFNGPSCLSRSTTIFNRLIDQCCEQIQKKRFREALPITETRSYRRRTAGEWNESTMHGIPFGNPSWGTAVVEVSLQTATMELTVPRIWLSLDCGPVLDRAAARSYVEAEVRLALCQCLHKQAIRPSEFPELHIRYRPPAGKNAQPGGLEGLILGTVPSAFAQAASQASGLPVPGLPLYSGDLLQGGF